MRLGRVFWNSGRRNFPPCSGNGLQKSWTYTPWKTFLSACVAKKRCFIGNGSTGHYSSVLKSMMGFMLRWSEMPLLPFFFLLPLPTLPCSPSPFFYKWVLMGCEVVRLTLFHDLCAFDLAWSVFSLCCTGSPTSLSVLFLKTKIKNVKKKELAQ